jgi:hypothetical protein
MGINLNAPRRRRHGKRSSLGSSGAPGLAEGTGHADGLGSVATNPKPSAFTFSSQGTREKGMSSRTTVKARTQRKTSEYDLGFTWGVLNRILLGLGIAVLVAGYVALSRGSTTLAPVLLVLGYCGLIPASLLWRSRNPATGE